jgi:hypothetical protein
MRESLDPLVGRIYTLTDGLRVRLRLSRGRDAAAIARLGPHEDISRLARFDPRRRVVICATALLDSTETVVGLGAIDLDAAEPDTLTVAEGIDPALEKLLGDALVAYAGATASRRVA